MKVYVPLDTAAVAVGADEVVEAIVAEAEARKVAVEIVRTGSRGMHWLEPLVEIERVGGARVAFGPVSVGDVKALFEADFASDHALAHGDPAEIPYLKGQDRQTFARCGIIDPLSFGAYCKSGGLAGLKRAASIGAVETIDEVMTSGLRGRGGAAFPSGIKWRTVAGAEAEQKYIVCNADEGDSGTFSDRMILEGDPFLLIEGMVIAGLAVGATKGFIYLRSEYPVAQRVLGQALEIAQREGLLGADAGGSGCAFDIELFMGAGAYICGEETSLLESLEGKRGQVRAKPPLPALEGLHGKPTLVHNVISLCAVPSVLANGGSWYHDFGVGRSTGTMPFQLAGNVKCGGLVEVAFGLSLHDLIYKFGGGTRSGKPVKAVQVGGPLGAYIPPSKFDMMMDYETFGKIGAGVGHGGIVVFDEDADLAQQAKYAFDFCAEESCGKCTPCRIGSVRGSEVMAKIISGSDVTENIELLTDLCEVMEDGSLCAMGGMTPVPVLSALKYFPEDFRAVKEGK
ncbi:MAG: formate dehydrogenase [Kordiimonadales bacterium]|nr:MAG: formate dehydrogenase [Kordiimonadales bacterium]